MGYEYIQLTSLQEHPVNIVYKVHNICLSCMYINFILIVWSIEEYKVECSKWARQLLSLCYCLPVWVSWQLTKVLIMTVACDHLNNIVRLNCLTLYIHFELIVWSIEEGSSECSKWARQLLSLCYYLPVCVSWQLTKVLIMTVACDHLNNIVRLNCLTLYIHFELIVWSIEEGSSACSKWARQLLSLCYYLPVCVSWQLTNEGTYHDCCMWSPK